MTLTTTSGMVFLEDLIKVIIANKLACTFSTIFLSGNLILGSSDTDLFGTSKVVWFSTDLNLTYFPSL